jgi:Family of unknown function (DUF5985)
MYEFMQGMIAMASIVACLFFLRFWRATTDNFFLLFSLAFGLDAITRTLLQMEQILNEQMPAIYLGRLATYSLILIAIVRKNSAGNRS